jgi:rhodanese-related sulfurtransferase
MDINTKIESFKNKVTTSLKPFGGIETSKPVEYSTYSCDEIKEILSIGGVLIDVRSPKEFNQSKLHNSRNIPLMHINASLSLKSKASPILLYSNNGYRSELAKEKLINSGYTNVHNIGKYSNYPLCS